MHEVVLQILVVRQFVRHCCEPGESFLINVDAQWINTIQQNVYTEIELEAVDEERLSDVALGDLMLMHVYPVDCLREEDTAAL